MWLPSVCLLVSSFLDRALRLIASLTKVALVFATGPGAASRWIISCLDVGEERVVIVVAFSKRYSSTAV